LKKSSELRANSNSNSKLELDVVGNSPIIGVIGFYRKVTFDMETECCCKIL